MTYPLLEGGSLLEGQRIRLGDDRYHVDDVRQLLKHDNVDGFQPGQRWSVQRIALCGIHDRGNIRMSRRLNEEQAAVNAIILHVAFSMRRQFVAQVG